MNTKPKRILLCDDEVHILRAAEIPLRHAGFDVVCASDGQAGWEEIQRQTPDILITDWHMPRLDGLGLIAKCREYPFTRQMPILMLSGRIFQPDCVELTEKYGVLAVLSKPFSFREMVRYIKQVLEEGTAELPVGAR
jgi:DNA-binding response OmpR family regulator